MKSQHHAVEPPIQPAAEGARGCMSERRKALRLLSSWSTKQPKAVVHGVAGAPDGPVQGGGPNHACGDTRLWGHVWAPLTDMEALEMLRELRK